MHNLTRRLYKEWAEYGSTVNATDPGMFTAEIMDVTEETEQFLAFKAAIGRAGKVVYIRKFILYHRTNHLYRGLYYYSLKNNF